MANCCFVDIEVTFETEEAAGNAYDLFHDREESLGVDEGVWLAGKTYLFDQDIQTSADMLYMHGWVKWAFQSWDAYDFLKFLKHFGKIKSMHIEYHEFGNCVYGHYSYVDGKFTDTYLPADHAPDYPEDIDDIDEDDLWETALEKYGKTIELTETSVMVEKRQVEEEACALFESAKKLKED